MLVKLIIVDSETRVLLVRNAETWSLPEVAIQRFTRIGYSATRAAKSKLGLDLFVILSVDLGVNSESSPCTDTVALVARLQTAGTEVPDNLAWKYQIEAPLSDEDQSILRNALKEFQLYDSGVKVSSFGRYSSLDELRGWYLPYLEELSLRETGIQQWNGDPWFALFQVNVEPTGEIRPETPKALWFKAVGEPNTREFAVTQALTQECPYWFPKVIATKPEWNGWLMQEVNGHELDEETDGRPWALTARILAKVQKRFIGREEELLSLGCRDWRIPRVIEALDPFFEDMQEIMQRQSLDGPRRFDRSELRELKTRCQDLCRRVEDVDVPYTIAHGDFSPHNVIVSNGWPVLIDWAEAYVSFPFISWEYFWNRMIKDHPEHSDWQERMHRNYAYRVWAPLLTKRRVDEGLKLSPAMAVLTLALYGIDDPEQRANRRADRVKRSLVRRLHRELDALDQTLVEPVGAL
jgi:hypothetical protein